MFLQIQSTWHSFVENELLLKDVEMLHTIARLACDKTRVVLGPIEQGSDIENQH